MRNAALWVGDGACVVDGELEGSVSLLELGVAACRGVVVVEASASAASRSAACWIKVLPTGAE